MLRFRSSSDTSYESEGVFTLMLMAIFVTELVVTSFLSSLFSRLGLYYASLLDAAILVVVIALPFWVFVVQPLYAKKSPQRRVPRLQIAGLYLAMLTGLFLTQFLVMMVLPSIMPQIDIENINIADACFTTLFSAPPLWWLTCSLKKCRNKYPAGYMLGDPLRLYVLLLFMIFLTDLMMDTMYPHLFPFLPHKYHIIVDAILSVLVTAPLLWWFLVQPLMKNALSQQKRTKAIYSQAVDAIITLDSQGMIESVNPAAEKIFGYDGDELTGRQGTLLFADEKRNLDDIIRTDTKSSSIESNIVSYEANGRRRDGSIVIIDVSISCILHEVQQEYLMIIRDISSRKRLEKEIRESEERFGLVVNGSNDGIWDWNVLADTVYLSPRFKALLGYRDDELENVFASFENNIHPDDHDRVMEAVNGHLEKNITYDIQYRLRTKPGTYRWFRARGQAVRDETGRAERMAGSISDISEQKEMIEALRESEVRFRQVFEQSEDAIIFFKPHSCSVIDVNATAEKLYGYTKAELQEAGLNLITGPEEFDLMANAITNIGRNRMAYLDKVVNLRKDGTKIFVSIRGKVMTLQGVDIIYCSFRDVSERLRMEKEAQDVQAKLIQTNKMTSLGLLVSGVAHEINNPNNFILANSQLLERSWTDSLKILREYFRENGEFFIGGVPFSELEVHSPRLFAGITDGARRIDSIVNNLKNFARNAGSSENSDVNVNQVASSAISILHYELNKFTENFQVILSENIPLVKGNGQQLGQIIINLLMNACQALSSRQCRIWLTTGFDAVADQVTVSVRDEGHGISPEKSKMIMEPFFTTKLDSGGTGLGLSICRSIVKDHSWFLDFSSEQGKGSTFTVRIPLTAEKEHSA